MKMKVVMYYNNKDIRVEEMPVPQIGADELLVKVMASGICGSDVMEWYRIKKAPRVLGHEIAGEIVKVGEKVKKYKLGDRVFVSHHVCCGKCEYCLAGYPTLCDTLHHTNFDPGGFAEYIRIPKINVERGTYILPAKVSYEDGTFVEPLGCVIRGQRLIQPLKNKTVLIIGSGIAGLLHIKLARFYGAKHIIATDISEYRLKMAKKFGADVVLNGKKNVPQEIYKINNKLADCVIISTANTIAIKQGLASVAKAGKVLFFAPTEPGVDISFPFFDIWNKQVILTSTYAAVKEDLALAIELISSHKIKVSDMITHRFNFKEAPLGFKLVSGSDKSIKVIIEPHKGKNQISKSKNTAQQSK